MSDYETKYFYNEDGFLYKIVQENGIPSYQNANEENKVSENIMDFSIGKFGESTQKQNSYETNSNGISKIIQYNKDGDVFRRYEIFYNSKGQIIKYDTFERNNIQKEYTKSFEYDTNSNLIKTSLVENYENEIKTIPRRNVIYNFSNNVITCKSSWNDFAEGTNSISDFSKIGGVTLNDFINKKKLKITISDKSIQEIKKGITQKWKNSVVDYEYIFHSEIKINNWEEKKIFNKLYKQTSEKELIYSIKRKYINKEELKKENKLTETREKLNGIIDDIESDEILKTKENSIRFAKLNVDIEDFCRWIRYNGQYSLKEDNNCSKEIVDFYKYNSNNLAKKYKEKIDNKILNYEDLNLELNEISSEYQKVIDQTIEKIQNRKIIVDSLLKDNSIFKLYKKPKIAGSPTFATNSRDPYEGFKKEDLYFAYKKLYKSIISETDINKHIELQKVQDKLFYLEPLNTKTLEKVLRNEKNETEIAKAILNFQVE
ncbi:hypothetical protein [Flavobacterium psychrophilum]|uniref:hypothetical protein n=1 Tax=Flavobacterium psychrophilum TaxID=96345 RepID=UPI000F507663|nr:hypothetical protein [Flavobacterium psychrophilum]